jgi:DNA-binding IclR family transcriptional regulator
MNHNPEDGKQGAVSLRTLERGLDVLDCFCHGKTNLSLTEISSRIGLNPSTTSRILSTLEMRNYIARNPETKRYQLGSQVWSLSVPSLESSDLRSLAAPHMLALYNMCNESVSLYVALDGRRVVLDRIETTHPLRRVINIGDRLSLSKGAGGKMLLAWMPEIERSQHGFEIPELTEELEKCKRQGFAVSAGERELGVGAIAAPIFSASGQVVAALGLSGPTVRFTNDFIHKMIPHIMRTAELISSDLGYRNEGTQGTVSS